MDPVIEDLREVLKDSLTGFGELKRVRGRGKKRFWVEVKPESLRKAIEKLRKTYKARLIEVAATDLGDEIEVVYYMDLPNGHVYLVKTRVPARKPEVESMASVCGSAAWYEREAYDHVGVVFKGHPGLRRVILPESVPPRFHPFRRKPI